MSFEIKPATRSGVKPLCGFYGKSGSGKTMSALLFARGLAGPNGRIVMIDSESGRGSLFADIIPGGYQVIEIGPPFSPERYQEAFEVAEQSADVVVFDSLSHEHTGEGGVLDMQEAELDRMAGDNWQKREACKMASWIKPKIAHKKFLQRILRCKCALICCLRGEDKTHITKEGGKSKVITDEFSSPIFDPRFIFELLVNFETVSRDGKGGYVIPRKVTHPAIEELLPLADERISIAHGEAIARWAENPVTCGPQKTSRDSLRKQLCRVAKENFSLTPADIESWLISEGMLGADEKLSAITDERMADITKQLERKPEGALL